MLRASSKAASASGSFQEHSEGSGQAVTHCELGGLWCPPGHSLEQLTHRVHEEHESWLHLALPWEERGTALD